MKYLALSSPWIAVAVSSFISPVLAVLMGACAVMGTLIIADAIGSE